MFCKRGRLSEHLGKSLVACLIHPWKSTADKFSLLEFIASESIENVNTLLRNACNQL